MADPVSLGLTLALTAAQMGLQASRKIEGPRLTDLSVSLGDPGDQKNYFLGTRRFDSCSFLFAEDLREVKKKRKTKGGKYNQYKYFGTWANHIADHPVDAVTRIWLDKHLVYDATGGGPISAFAAGGVYADLSEYLRFMLGAEDQEPDPRMLLTIEAQHGEGSCPAYRGQSLVMWEEVPLEKFGNRLPQPTIEAVTSAAPYYPFDLVDSSPSTGETPFLWTIMASPDGSRFYIGHLNSPTVTVWDAGTRSMMSEMKLDHGLGAMTPSGSFYSISGVWGDVYLAFTNPDGMYVILAGPGDFDEPPGGVAYVGGLVCVYPIFNWQQTQYWNPGTGRVEARYPGFSATHYFEDVNGRPWAVGQVGTDPKIAFSIMPYGEVNEVTTGETGDAFAIDGGNGAFFVWQGGKVMMVDTTSWTVTASTANNGVNVFTPPMAFRHSRPGQKSIWVGPTEYSTRDASIIRTVSLLDWPVGELADWVIYDPFNHALLTQSGATGNFVWRYLDRITGEGVTIAQIIAMVSDMCGVDDADYNASLCTDIVDGFSFTPGAAKSILSPVLEAHDIDPVSEDFIVRFRPRGTASEGFIPTGKIVRSGDKRFSITVAKDEDLPLQVTMAFADVDKDQQGNVAESARAADAVRTKRVTQLDMRNVATDVDNARQLTDRFMRRQHYEKESYELAISDRYLKITPGSVYTMELDESERTARCVSTRIGADRITETQWVRDNPSLAGRSSGTGAPMDSRAPSQILVPALSKGMVIDAPLAVDSDESASPFLMVAAGPYGQDVYWTGAEIWASDSGDEDEFDPDWAAVPYQSAATWGYCTDVLGDALPWVPDMGNVVTVFMGHGELSSVTMDELLLDDSLNLALIGSEYVQFATATLVAPRTYELSGLLRGRRGTEQHLSMHAVRDRLLLIDAAVLKRSMGVSEIGDTDYYKAITQGRDDASAPVETVTFGAAAQKPYAPVHGALTLDSGSGDWSIDAVRRTRLGGANVDGQDVPLGETGESWSCDILDGAVVVRTIAGDSLPLAYSSAQQTVDFGAPQSSLTVNLYQVAPPLSLRGFPLQIAA
ncbi:hypothetical protein MRBLMA1_001248 [Sphingobium sp. LMA1-1-1.1]|uniref:phage tail protein n=1 Tax=Sphingobium sp. LMA1-1-1.1 TaxID=3135238 RepID=UPI0034266081